MFNLANFCVNIVHFWSQICHWSDLLNFWRVSYFFLIYKHQSLLLNQIVFLLIQNEVVFQAWNQSDLHDFLTCDLEMLEMISVFELLPVSLEFFVDKIFNILLNSLFQG